MYVFLILDACVRVSMQEDVELIAKLGFGAYRFSISWPRIFPGTVKSLNIVMFYSFLRCEMDTFISAFIFAFIFFFLIIDYSVGFYFKTDSLPSLILISENLMQKLPHICFLSNRASELFFFFFFEWWWAAMWWQWFGFLEQWNGLHTCMSIRFPNSNYITDKNYNCITPGQGYNYITSVN